MNGHRIRLVLAVAAACAIVGTCVVSDNDDTITLRDEVEEVTGPFDASWFTDPEHAHAALFFDVEEGLLRPQDRPAERRPGRLPYLNHRGGPVWVIFLDGDGEEIGRYATEHPATSRACGVESAPRVAALETGTVEVLLPADPRIGTLIFDTADETLEFDVSTYMSEL